MHQPRPDYRVIAALCGEQRSAEQLIEHYDLETRLADELRHAPEDVRPETYSRVYTTLFDSLPHHPAHKKQAASETYVSKQSEVLSHFIPKDGVFVEIGAGDCRLSLAMCRRCARAIAVDVTDAVIDRTSVPENFQFLLTDGVHLNIPSRSVDLVYSHQVMEHLHPDDVAEQLSEIHRILKPGGVYFCITPNRLSGPHDISRYFDREAKGLHMHEYTHAELGRTFRNAGFRKATPIFLAKGKRLTTSLWFASFMEKIIGGLDYLSGRRLRRMGKVQSLLGVSMLAVK